MTNNSISININVESINSSNVNDINPANKLNNFEFLCALLPLQQNQETKNFLENLTVHLLNKMISIPETNWDRKDTTNNNMLERALWSSSSKIMEVFHQNPDIINKFVAIEKNQILNFWRIMTESHIPNAFRTEQIEKFKKLGLGINDFGQDNHTIIHNSIYYYYLNAYLSKYTNIVNMQNNEIIQADQLKINENSR